jgi:hypothetical protein
LIQDVAFENCRVTNAITGIYRNTISASTNIVTLTNTIIDTCTDGVYITGGTGTDTDSSWSRVLIHTCSGYGLYCDVSDAVLLMDHVTITKCDTGIGWAASWATGSAGASLTNSIVFGNITGDIDLLVANTGRITYTLTRTASGADVTVTSGFSGDPYFVSATDFNLRDTAAGYPINSLGIGAASDGFDLGVYKVTRSATYAYAVDFTLSVQPSTTTRTHQASDVSTNVDQYGAYSDTIGGVRRSWTMQWDAGSAGDLWEYQVEYLAYLQSLENVVYQFGVYTGAAWVPRLSGTGTVSGKTITVQENGVPWAPNRFAGDWIKINSVYHRIASHPEKAAGTIAAPVDCVLTLDTTPTTGSQAFSIDYTLVRIDKRPGLSLRKYEVGNATQPYTGYQLTLKEVDDYGV